MASAARRQIIGGGASINKSRQLRRSQILGGGCRRTALAWKKKEADALLPHVKLQLY